MKRKLRGQRQRNKKTPIARRKKKGGKFVGLRTLYIGESKSGKTTKLMKDLMKMMFDKNGKLHPSWSKKLKIILVMPTLDTNAAFKDGEFPELMKLFRDKSRTSWFKEWNDYVSDIIHKAMLKFKDKKQLLVILDDVGANGGIKNGGASNTLKTIGTIAPHMDVILIGLFQRMIQTPMELRQNFDQAHLFRTENRDELNHIHRTFFGKMRAFKDFNQVFINKFEEPFDCFTIERGKGGTRKFFMNGKKLFLPELE